MIGLYGNDKQRISSHLSNYVQNKETMSHDIDELKQKIEGSYKEQQEKYSKLLFDVENIKEGLKTTVNVDDLNDLIDDVRNSFELFLNNTPRQNELEKLLRTLEVKVNDLEARMNAFFGNGEVELITVENTQKEVKKCKVPKLDISRKK